MLAKVVEDHAYAVGRAQGSAVWEPEGFQTGHIALRFEIGIQPGKVASWPLLPHVMHERFDYDQVG